MNFIWRIILMPFMPVVNAWRKSWMQIDLHG
jgi:hypothetical protein